MSGVMQEFSAERQKMFARHAAAAAAAVAIEAAIACPLDSLKTIQQVTTDLNKRASASSIISKTWSLRGPSGFYSGFKWMFFGRVPALGLRFGAFELLAAYCKDGRGQDYVFAKEALVSGFACGVLESFFVTPFELFKTRSQVASYTGYSASCSSSPSPSLRNASIVLKLMPCYTPDIKLWDRTYRLLSALPHMNLNVMSSLQQYPWLITGSGRFPSIRDLKRPIDSISLEGWNVLWKGLRPGVFRDAIFGSVFFGSWQGLHNILLQYKKMKTDPFPETIDGVEPLSPAQLSVTAALSGSIAAIASHPFDTVKSRSQCLVIPKYVAMERRLNKEKPHGTKFQLLAGIDPKEQALMYRSLWIRTAQSGVSCFVLVGAYHIALNYLLN